MLDRKRKREARKNLQMLIEAYLREESSMRWGASNNQIRAAAKQMTVSGLVPAKVAIRIKEHLSALRESKAGAVLQRE